MQQQATGYAPLLLYGVMSERDVSFFPPLLRVKADENFKRLDLFMVSTTQNRR